MKKISHIYIHIPFCKNLCGFCNFYKTALFKHQEIINNNSFANAIIDELRLYENIICKKPISIYFGGGSPLSIGKINLEIITNYLNKQYDLSDCEITIESNPIFQDILSVPTIINRVSIGIQSFQKENLRILQRSLIPERNILEKACHLFKNISVDLIYNIPGATLTSIYDDINIVSSYPIKHLSCYTLEASKKVDNRVNDNDEKDFAKQFLKIEEILKTKLFNRYEISNFAKQNYECKHNLAYWQYKPFLGIGPGASGTIFSKESDKTLLRYRNNKNIDRYIFMTKNNRQPIAEQEQLSLIDQYNEYILTAFRTSVGINIKTIKEHYEIDFLTDFKYALIKHKNYTENDQKTVKLLKYGKLYYNSIVSDFIKIQGNT